MTTDDIEPFLRMTMYVNVIVLVTIACFRIDTCIVFFLKMFVDSFRRYCYYAISIEKTNRTMINQNFWNQVRISWNSNFKLLSLTHPEKRTKDQQQRTIIEESKMFFSQNSYVALIGIILSVIIMIRWLFVK